MNQPTQPITSTSDAQKLIEALKMSLVSNWTGAQAAVDFFIHQAETQTRRIEMLEKNVASLQKMTQEKDNRISMMARKVLELEAALMAKDKELQGVKTDNGKMKTAIKNGLEGVVNQRKQLEMLEARFDKAISEGETLRAKLAEAEQRAAEVDPQGYALTATQLKNLEAVIKQELIASGRLGKF